MAKKLLSVKELPKAFDKKFELKKFVETFMRLFYQQ